MILTLTVLCLLTAGCASTKTTEGTPAEVSLTNGTLTVQGLCDMCKSRIEKTALGIEGVAKAEWAKDTKILTLQFDAGKTNLETISKALAEVGHDTDRDKADDEVYNNLPGCCQYRK